MALKMSKMNECLSVIDSQKPKFYNHDTKEYSNFNLNQSIYKDSDVLIVQSASKSYIDKPFVADSYDKKNNSESFPKASMINGSYLNIWNSGIIESEKEIKKRWMNDKSTTTSSSSSNNSSTLSLHIAAYENSVESAANQKSLNEKKQVRKRKNAKQVFTAASTSLIQNPFEFPRQQNNQPATPEVMQFKSNQQLADPNNNQQAPAATPPPPAAPPAPGAAPVAAPVQQPPQGAPPAAQPGAQQPAVIQVQVSPAPSPAQGYPQPAQGYPQPAQGYPPQPQAYAAAPAVLPNVAGCQQSTQVTCPSCRAVVMTRVQTTMSSTDILMIVIGFFFIFFIFGLVLLCIALCCSPWRDVTHSCPQCNHHIGKA